MRYLRGPAALVILIGSIMLGGLVLALPGQPDPIALVAATSILTAGQLLAGMTAGGPRRPLLCLSGLSGFLALYMLSAIPWPLDAETGPTFLMLSGYLTLAVAAGALAGSRRMRIASVVVVLGASLAAYGALNAAIAYQVASWGPAQVYSTILALSLFATWFAMLGLVLIRRARPGPSAELAM
jgi:hypothetical protein